ncbi:AI-2E family transporter [Rhizobium sp. T1470]|uniref:AI-2E family transporter n=1 Tax=unclassified Rhizobium TaxID=2613769 RepID=UPI001AAF6DB7|nr:AI-2E family transporter [Rhizobium sp. T1473]MCA0803921.1 AI-2E family transporter [Rhizobium sp. T1473]
MLARRTVPATPVLIAVLLLVAMLSMAKTVLAPLTFALLVIALLWPMQRRMQRIVPRYVALLVSLFVVVMAFVVFAWIVAWSFGQVGRWVIADASRFQQHYEEIRLWLEDHGIVVAVLSADSFSTASILRAVQTVSSRVNSAFSFWLIALTYVLLGIMEVEDFERRIAGMRSQVARKLLLDGRRQTAQKLRRYMAIRTVMSIATGLLVWLFARAVGLPLAEEWGAIAFALNYIPFIGPLVATLFPTMFALIQFDSWQSVLAIFLGLNLIQFTIGSYIEPRVSGNALSLSPVIVLFSVFAWGYLWGIFGAFIGVPISIALLTFCRHHPSSQWVVELFGAGGEGDAAPPPP